MASSRVCSFLEQDLSFYSLCLKIKPLHFFAPQFFFAILVYLDVIFLDTILYILSLTLISILSIWMLKLILLSVCFSFIFELFFSIWADQTAPSTVSLTSSCGSSFALVYFIFFNQNFPILLKPNFHLKSHFVESWLSFSLMFKISTIFKPNTILLLFFSTFTSPTIHCCWLEWGQVLYYSGLSKETEPTGYR